MGKTRKTDGKLESRFRVHMMENLPKNFPSCSSRFSHAIFIEKRCGFRYETGSNRIALFGTSCSGVKIRICLCATDCCLCLSVSRAHVKHKNGRAFQMTYFWVDRVSHCSKMKRIEWVAYRSSQTNSSVLKFQATFPASDDFVSFQSFKFSFLSFYDSNRSQSLNFV